MNKYYNLGAEGKYIIEARKVSGYGLDRGYLDYAGLSSLVSNMVLANSVPLDTFIEELPEGTWIDQYYGFIEEEGLSEEGYDAYEYLYDSLESAYQLYAVDDNSATMLQELGEVVLYSSELDLNLWCIFHYGTAWDYVLTNIELIEGGN